VPSLITVKSEHHIPVLREMVSRYLISKPGGVYIDGTVGFGGHAVFLLDRLDARAVYVAIDQDGNALQSAQERLANFNNVKYFHNNFSEMGEIVKELNLDHVDGVLMDLGVSSFQIDNDERGFSYMKDVPLDMRMGSRQQRTAADILNEEPVERLIEIFRLYGEEHKAAPIARSIEKERRNGQIVSAGVLTEVIARVVHGKHRVKSYARIFQALRIAVNDELEHLKRGLEVGFTLLSKGGRMVVLSYHSLEDRIVKQFFVKKARVCSCPPHFPVCICSGKQELRILTKKVVRPSIDEVSNNPRARSAKLRAGERL
jgi:16S rRNA (cytosine1402-N4)-methyltransferase